MTAEPEVPPAGNPDIRYYQVEPAAQEGGPPEVTRPETVSGRRGRLFWVLVALAVVIVVLLVVLAVIEVFDGRAVESSFGGSVGVALFGALGLG